MLYFILTLFVSGITYAAKITTAGSGNWSSTVPNAPWPGGIIPAVGDDIVVGNNHTLTVNGNRTCNSIEFSAAGNGTGSGALIVNLNFTLTITTTLFAPGSTVGIKNNSTYSISGAGTLNCVNIICGNSISPSGSSGTVIRLNSTIANANLSGSLSLVSSQNGTKSNNAYINIQSGKVSVTGSVISTNGGAGNVSTLDLVSSSASPHLELKNTIPFNLSGTGTNTTSFNGTGTNVEYSNAIAQIVRAVAYTNLTLSGGGAKTITGSTINGTLSLQGTATATGTVPTYGVASGLEYKGSAAQVTGIEFPATWSGTGGVFINNASGVSLSAAKNLGTSPFAIGNLVSNSLFSDAGFQLSSTGILNLVSGTFQLGSAGTATSFPLFGTRNISAGTTVSYISDVTQTVAAINYSNLSLSGGLKNAAASTIAVAATLTNTTVFNLAGFTLTSGTTNNTGGTIRFSGTSNGIAVASGTVDYYGASQTIATGNYTNLIVNQSSGNATISGSVSISGILTLTAGIINAGAHVISVTNNSVAAIVRTSGYVSGALNRAIATGTNVYDFPVGTGLGYTPASLSFNSVAVGGSIIVQSKDGVAASFPATMDATKRLLRHWIVNNSGLSGFTINANFTYLLGDLGGGVTTAELKGFQTSVGPVYAAVLSSFSGTNFLYNGISNLDNTAGFSTFGAGVCSNLTPNFTKTMASNCGAGVDGTITANPTTGISPYTYSWTGPGGFTATTAAITALGVGDYTVVITEATGCSTTWADITIWQALAPVVTNSGSNSGTCNASGSILLYGSYGVPPYTYSIDGTNYQVSNTFLNVAAGTYTGYVKDLQGCVSTKPNIVINAATAMAVTAYARSASSCANNGSIELYRTGGIGPYTYSLDNVTYQASNTFTNLPGGTYTGWVKDSKGCTASLGSVIVTQATGVSVTATKTNTSACSNTGVVELYPTGGVPGFTYSLTNAGGPYQTSNVFSGLAAGTYRFWAQDSKGCKNFVDVTIAVGVSGSLSLTASTKPSGTCNNSGQIEIFLTGGSRSPYSYSLDDVNYQVYNNKFTGLAPGSYTGWVKDANGCKWSLPGIVVGNAGPLTLNAKISHESLCVVDGAITLLASQGVPGYMYSLDDITYQTSAVFQGLTAGNYTGWLKDATGCKVSLPITVLPNPIVVTAYANPALNCGSNNGNIQIFRTGGVWPYVHSIDGVNYVSDMKFLNLAPGMYTAYVKDARGCVGTLTNIEVGPVCLQSKGQTNVKNQLNTDVHVMVFPNPSSSEFNLQFTNHKNSINSIKVTDLTGRIVYTSNRSVKQSIRFGAAFKPGIYFVEVIQGNNKQVIKLIKE